MNHHIVRVAAILAALAAAGLVVQPAAPPAGAEAGAPAGSPADADCTQPGPYQLPQGKAPVRLDPADFRTRIDNPWWPMEPGTRWHYVERGGGEVSRVTTTVTRRTKVIGGIRARVIHDVVRLRGQVVEDTLDWYAQDSGGSIWYLGEATKEYENGHLVSTKGSWQHGVDGGQAGVIVPAAPGVGCVYREEYHAPDAKDRARVLSTSEGIKGPTGYYRRTLHTANTTPVQPRLLENKFYGRGVGPILELDLSPTLGSAVLVRVTHR